jgi:hypothetical protein
MVRVSAPPLAAATLADLLPGVIRLARPPVTTGWMGFSSSISSPVLPGIPFQDKVGSQVLVAQLQRYLEMAPAMSCQEYAGVCLEVSVDASLEKRLALDDRGAGVEGGLELDDDVVRTGSKPCGGTTPHRQGVFGGVGGREIIESVRQAAHADSLIVPHAIV